MKIRLEFEPRDLWIGVYWNMWEDWAGLPMLDVYICLIPMFPIHIEWQGGV